MGLINRQGQRDKDKGTDERVTMSLTLFVWDNETINQNGRDTRPTEQNKKQ